LLGVSETTIRTMRFLLLGLLFFSAWISNALSDSLGGAPADSELQTLTPPPQQVESADSVHQSAPVVQNWILPLALIVAVGTSFFVIFMVRSR